MGNPPGDPYPESPGDFDRRLDEARARITAMHALPQEVRDILVQRAAEFVEASFHRSPPNFRHYGMQLGWRRYAVRTDHLDIVATAGPVALALATFATAVTPVSPAAMILSLLLAVLTVARKFGKKAAALTSDEYALIMALKRLGKATPQQLLDVLDDIRLFKIGTWSLDRVTEMLRHLENVRLPDGSLEAFVVPDASGIWSVNGI